MCELNTSNIDLYRWTTAIVTLSLDVAAPHIPYMGLSLPASFQEGARSIISNLRAQDLEPELSAVYATELIAWTTQKHGDQIARNLYIWVNQVFDYGLAENHGASSFLWDSVVRHQGYRGLSLPSPPPFITEVRRRMDLDVPVDIDEPKPTSDWDQSMYAWRNYDLHTYTPMTTVSLTIDDFRFRRAWSETHKSLPRELDLPTVRLWALEVAKQMDLPLDRLGEPGSWPDLPTLL